MNLPKTLFAAWILLPLFILSCAPKEEEEKVAPQHIQPISAVGDLHLSTGQTVYVPAYSQIHSGNKDARINLAVTLSIRNTDLDNPIIIKSVTYYNDDGSLLKEYVETPLQLAPMASVSLNIGKTEKGGGIGANFIVKWGAEQTVYEPFIEAIMLGSLGNHGYSWRSPGHVVQEFAK